MAEVASESWWIKLGVMYDKSGFKAAIGGMLDLKRVVGSLADTYKEVINSGASLYNNAKYLGVSTSQLQIWERTFRRIGGSAQEAQENINNLNFIASKLRLGEGGEKATIAARLGLEPSDLLDYETAMKALNRSFNQNAAFGTANYKVFRELAQQLGLSQYAIKLVTMSMDEYDKTIKDTQAIGLIPEHQLKAAEKLREQFEIMKITWENFKNSVVSATFPALNELMQHIGSVLKDPQVQKSIASLLKLFEAKLDELVSNGNVTKFFEQLHDGIMSITSDESIHAFVETMSTLFKAIDYGIVKPVLTAGKGYGHLAVAAADIQTELESGRPGNRHELIRVGEYFSNAYKWTPGAIAARTGQAVANYTIGNITINGVRNAEDVPAALQNAATDNVAMRQQVKRNESMEPL